MASLKRMKEGLIQEDSDEFLGLWDSVLNVEHVGVEVAFLYSIPFRSHRARRLGRGYPPFLQRRFVGD